MHVLCDFCDLLQIYIVHNFDFADNADNANQQVWECEYLYQADIDCNCGSVSESE